MGKLAPHRNDRRLGDRLLSIIAYSLIRFADLCYYLHLFLTINLRISFRQLNVTLVLTYHKSILDSVPYDGFELFDDQKMSASPHCQVAIKLKALLYINETSDEVATNIQPELGLTEIN